jgi:cell division protein FtsN
MAVSRRRRTTRSKPAPPWLWSITGLVVGLLVAFLVFLQMRPKEVPVTETAQPLAVPAEQDRPVAPTPNKPKAAPVPPPPKPRFDFYNLLPEMEVIVPDEDIQGQPTHEGVKQVEQPGTYLLQAGSFRSRQQADQLRARLALLGLETSVQAVTVDNAQTWHRVRVGPFNNLRDLNDARALLRRNGVDAILIRLKG